MASRRSCSGDPASVRSRRRSSRHRTARLASRRKRRFADLVALSRHARLIVSGDTGPLHIAAAVGVPAVGVFGPTNPRRNGPWRDEDISISRYDVCDCHYERRCRRDDDALVSRVDLGRGSRGGDRHAARTAGGFTACVTGAAGLDRIARLRVPLGFACAVVAFWLARPSPASVLAGMSVAALGELIRLWAAGHIEKGREITRSGPYRFMRHPLYAGSAVMGVGFMIAATEPCRPPWSSASISSSR